MQLELLHSLADQTLSKRGLVKLKYLGFALLVQEFSGWKSVVIELKCVRFARKLLVLCSANYLKLQVETVMLAE